jgi:predicted dehydrogenase
VKAKMDEMPKITNQSNKPLNVALIGYGYAGKTFHAPLIAHTKGLNLAAIVSSNNAKVLKDFPKISIFSLPDDAFIRPEIDLVVIATPNDTHFELGQKALKAGKHVIVDKPFTLTVAEATMLVRMAKDTNKHISVFQNRRWDSDFLTVRQILSEGKLGEIVSFQSSFNRYRPEVKQRWREQALPGSGLWYDIGSHLVDQTVLLFGAPDTVYADFAMQRVGASTVDYFHVLLKYGKKRIILHGSSLVSGDSRRFAVHGTAGSFIKDGMDIQESQLKEGDKLGGDNWVADPSEGVLFTWKNDSLKSDSLVNIAGNYGSYYAAIRETIQHGAANPVTAAEAVTVMNILALGSRSAELGKELDFDKSYMCTGFTVHQAEEVIGVI